MKLIALKILLCLCLLLPLHGCAIGWLYTDITQPLVTNMNGNPAGTRSGKSDTKHLKIYYVDLLWDSNAIGDAAKKHGIQDIYYADMHTLSLLGGLWVQQYAIVVGD